MDGKITGNVAPGFEGVAEAFATNFRDHGDIGASFCVVRDGHPVVDLWGGVADPESGAPWQPDTLANVWSTTKGIVGIAFALIVERGLADYEDSVASYWPEFAAHGKGEATIAQLLSHQVGLTGFRDPVAIEALYDPVAAAERLAAAEPFWLPGSTAGYHAIAVGFLVDGLFRRIDGRSVRQFFAEEFASHDIHLGLPAQEEARCAVMIAPPAFSSSDLVHDLTPAQLAALANPPLDPLLPNTSGWRGAQIPSANGFANARGIAALYGAFVNGLVSPATLAAATEVRFEGKDAVLGHQARWACGFLRNTGAYGPGEGAFGHSGWGGSFAFADPDRRWGVAFTMNRMGTDLIGDPRNLELVKALYAAAA